MRTGSSTKARNVLLLAFLIQASVYLPSEAADQHTVYHAERSKSANLSPFPGLSDDQSELFALGRSFFHIPWVEAPSATTARDGLGPLFNANACVSCHQNNGGGAGIATPGQIDRSVPVKLFVGKSARQAYLGDPVYGNQLSINGNTDVPFEARVRAELEFTSYRYADGKTIDLHKPRIVLDQLNYGPLGEKTTVNPVKAPVLIGLGLIESIPEQQILAHEDEDDANGDGISGRANRVWSVAYRDYRLGRYGWKAATPSVIEQTAHALNDDMGLTSQWLRQDNCGPEQTRCLQAYQSSELDVPEQRVTAIAFYLKHLRVAKSSQAEKMPGKQIFAALGCGSCHRGGYHNDEGVEISPYSDFLLHDMGDGLASSMSMFEAQPSEWRTAPLWGLGLHKLMNPKAGFLHDGRAATIEQAILWHGGEAQISRDAFAALSEGDRVLLIEFLNTL